MTKQILQKEGLQKIKVDFQYLLLLFQEMLISIGEKDLATNLPFGDREGKQQLETHNEKMVQAIGICFELLNIAEENAATQFRRKSESKFGLESTRGPVLRSGYECRRNSFSARCSRSP